MPGNMMEELSRKTLKSYVKLGESMGLWSSLDQKHINLRGETTRRIIIDWNNTKEEWNE
jgi:hypothetical protein